MPPSDFFDRALPSLLSTAIKGQTKPPLETSNYPGSTSVCHLFRPLTSASLSSARFNPGWHCYTDVRVIFSEKAPASLIFTAIEGQTKTPLETSNSPSSTPVCHLFRRLTSARLTYGRFTPSWVVIFST